MIRFDKKELAQDSPHYYFQDVEVRFQDVDAANVVFFSRFFDYVHGVYEGLLRELGSPLPQVLKEGIWAAPLRHVEADYLSPVRFGDSLRIALVGAHVEESELTLGWRLAQRRSPVGQVVAVVQTVHTFIDPVRRERTSIPPEFMKLLADSPRGTASE
jgi:1,4-dihydroxy-2-naphthoyl-CoA hydrolase